MHKQRIILALSLGLSLLSSCNINSKKDVVALGSDTSSVANSTKSIGKDVLWVQNSAEYVALCLQTYTLAERKLKSLAESATLTNINNKPAAIVLDLDETVLDNSPYQAYLVLNEQRFSYESWGKWIKLQAARPVPGSKEFLIAASELVEIFYVSNRQNKYLADTYKNLEKLGLPVKKENILLKTTTSSKSKRREQISSKHNIVMYFGDNLADLSDDFEGKETNQHYQEIIYKNQQQLGEKYFVLPNPSYGKWLNAVHGYSYDLNPEMEYLLESKALKTFE
jgi:5'-nucleotidase (lipoprotein e(P4) family)